MIPPMPGSDAERLESLAEKHGRMIWRVAYRFLRNVEDARDVTQEVLLKLHKHLPRIPGHTNIVAWLYRVTANEALNELRAGARRARLEGEAAESIGPREVDAAQGLAGAIARGISPLPRQQRAVVTLRLIEGLTFREIAALFDLSEGTVKVHFARGLKRLRDALADWR